MCALRLTFDSKASLPVWRSSESKISVSAFLTLFAAWRLKASPIFCVCLVNKRKVKFYTVKNTPSAFSIISELWGRWKLRLAGAYSLLNPYHHIPLL